MNILLNVFFIKFKMNFINNLYNYVFHYYKQRYAVYIGPGWDIFPITWGGIRKYKEIIYVDALPINGHFGNTNHLCKTQTHLAKTIASLIRKTGGTVDYWKECDGVWKFDLGDCLLTYYMNTDEEYFRKSNEFKEIREKTDLLWVSGFLPWSNDHMIDVKILKDYNKIFPRLRKVYCVEHLSKRIIDNVGKEKVVTVNNYNMSYNFELYYDELVLGKKSIDDFEKLSFYFYKEIKYPHGDYKKSNQLPRLFSVK